VVSFTARLLYPRHPLNRRLGRPQNRSGGRGKEKNLAPTGTRTPTPRPPSPFPVATPTELSRREPNNNWNRRNGNNNTINQSNQGYGFLILMNCAYTVMWIENAKSECANCVCSGTDCTFNHIKTVTYV
jgi:hypothetical protein